MPLTLIEKPFNSPDYYFENKWDGYRCICFVDGNNLILQSRGLKNITSSFPELKSLPSSIKADNAVLDGELCILDERGRPAFESIKSAAGLTNPLKVNTRARREAATYIVWDLLFLNNSNLKKRPLRERKELLSAIIREGKGLLYSHHLHQQGEELFQQIKAAGLEGMVAKKKNSPYLHRKNKYWLKIKCFKYLKARIGGYIEKGALTLLLGLLEGAGLKYIGSLSSGLREEEIETLKKRLPSLKTPTAPFKEKITKEGINWVKPVLKCRVRYLELTENERLRHATLWGLEG